MALIERLMRLKDDGTPMDENDESLFIPTHKFLGAAGELINSRQTVAEVKAALGMRSTSDANGRSDTGEFDALRALAPASNNPAGRALWLNGISNIFLLASFGDASNPDNYPGYNTPAQIRAKLGIP